jgi:hypothetical protein
MVNVTDDDASRMDTALLVLRRYQDVEFGGIVDEA